MKKSLKLIHFNLLMKGIKKSFNQKNMNFNDNIEN